MDVGLPPWLRGLGIGLSHRRSRFSPRSVHVKFVVDRVALGQVLLQILQFSPCHHASNAPYLYSSTHFSCHKHKLAKPENLPKSNALSRNRGSLDRKEVNLYIKLAWCDTQYNRRCWLTDFVICSWQRSRGSTFVREVDGKCCVLQHHGAPDVLCASYSLILLYPPGSHNAAALAVLCARFCFGLLAQYALNKRLGGR